MLDLKSTLEYLRDQHMTLVKKNNGSMLVSISNEGQQGELHVYPLYQGISLITGVFHLQMIEIAPVDNMNRLLMNYCIEGRCEVDLGDNRYIFLEPGYLSLDVNPAQNCFRCPTGNYTGVAVLFDFDILDYNMPAVFADLDIYPDQLRKRFCELRSSYIERASEKMKDLFMSIFNEPNEPLSMYRLILFRIIKMLDAMNPDSRLDEIRWLTKGQIDIAKRVEKRIVENLKTKHSIIELAKEYCVSASSLKNYFNRVYGEPISVYLRNKRMIAAQELLEQTNLSIAQIALSVGYENQSKFASVFKRYGGTSPVEYRRINRAKKM